MKALMIGLLALTLVACNRTHAEDAPVCITDETVPSVTRLAEAAQATLTIFRNTEFTAVVKATEELFPEMGLADVLDGADGIMFLQAEGNPATYGGLLRGECVIAHGMFKTENVTAIIVKAFKGA